MKRILVTGGAGYIGSACTKVLVDKGFDVVLVDNLVNGKESLVHKKAEFFKLDLAKDNIDKVFEKQIDAVIHFAAYKAVGESVEQPLMYYDNNLNTLSNILKCQEKFNVPNLIFSSSCSVDGNTKELPVTEETPLERTESPYAYTKQIGEVMVNDFMKINKYLKAISLRYFNPVGAHITGLNGELSNTKPNNLIPFITQTAIGKQESLTVFGSNYNTIDGTCVRDYIHVSDIANAHVLALQELINGSISKNHDIINLGTGIGVSVLEAIKAFEKVSGKKLSYSIGEKREGDVEAIYANNEKAKKLLKWTPKLNLDDMMLSAWKWENHLANK